MGGSSTKVGPNQPQPVAQKPSDLVSKITTNTAKKMRPKHTLDKSLENGPAAERGCTDIICFVMFIGMVGVVLYIMGVAYSRGDPWKLAQPFDVDGNPCGAVNSITTVTRF
jgi:solute carrier family 44 (choline transporter-like protein), member 2/4/5